MTLELTGKQTSHLKAAGQRLEVAVRVGKAGLSDALIGQVRSVFAGRELVKVRLGAGPAAQRRQSAKLLAQAVDAAVVAIVGRNALLYRPNEGIIEQP